MRVRNPKLPVLWTRGEPTYKPFRGASTTNRDGIEERKPALCSFGFEYDEMPTHPHAHRRYRDVLKHDGNIVSQVMTNAAADLDTDSSFTRYQVAKANHFGWFPVALCPIRLLRAGALKPQHFVERSLLKAHVCPKGPVPEGGCEHLIAERDARRAANKPSPIEVVLQESLEREQNATAVAAAKAAAVAVTEALERRERKRNGP